MGVRKRVKAEQRREKNKKIAFASLKNSPIAPRKMRMVADLIRGVEVNKALNILEHNPKDASKSLSTLLRSAIANWEMKNEDASLEDETLIVKEIQVSSAGMLKRITPRAQGRAHRIRKRSNHVRIVVDGIKN